VAAGLPRRLVDPRPAIKADLVLTDGALAVGVLGLEAGAIVGLPVGAVLVARLGGRRALRIGFVIGRLFGDRLVARVGRARLVQINAVVTGAGAALVVFGPGAAFGLVGWALFGLVTVAPTVLGAAPRAGDAPPAAAIAMVTTVGYLGSFTGPPVIGLLAQASSLSSGPLLLVALAAALGLLARPALGSAR
jgi:hypothetical protein